MDQLYPIIRRARRPLLPPDEPKQRVIIPVTVEPSPVVAVPIVMASIEPEPAELVSVEPAPVEPPPRRSRKEKKRAEIPTT